MLMKRMTKRLMLALTTALLLTLLMVTAYAGTIPGTAKLTITPTETKVSGDTATGDLLRYGHTAGGESAGCVQRPVAAVCGHDADPGCQRHHHG